MGGLMRIYALMEYNHVFSRGAALSPSLWISPVEVHNMLSSAHFAPDTVLYMDYGSEEFGNHKNMRRAFGEVATLLMWKKLSLHAALFLAELIVKQAGKNRFHSLWKHCYMD